MNNYVLVAEDSFLVALWLKSTLTDLGYSVLGPAATSADALALLDETPEIDFAVLDVTLRDGSCAAIIDRLRSHGRPFLLATGYADLDFDGLLAGLPKPVTIRKPFARDTLLAAIEKVVQD